MYNSNIVDVFDDSLLNKDNTRKFTQKHAERCKQLINPDAYPEYFGDLIPEGFEFVEIDIIDDDLIDWDIVNGNLTQISRASGLNPRLDDIATNIKMHGYKLRSIPIMLLKLPNGRYRPINGRTRKQVLNGTGFGFTNYICSIYKPKSNLTDSQIEDIVSQWGLIANAENDPAGDLQIEDVIREVKYAISKGWLKLTKNGKKNLELISERVEKLCGKGIFTDDKRATISSRIFNNLSATAGNQKILGWEASSSQEFLRKSKYKDIEPKYNENGILEKKGIKYFLISSSTGDKAFIKSMQCANKNKDCDVRVIIHTGLLKGYDQAKTYVEKIYGFRRFWDDTVDLVQYAYTNGIKLQPKVTLYGALPAVESLGSLEELVIFKNYTVDSKEELVGDKLTDGLILKK